MTETMSNIAGIIVIVLLCLMVLSLLLCGVSMLMDSIGEWKERKAKIPPKKWKGDKK